MTAAPAVHGAPTTFEGSSAGDALRRLEAVAAGAAGAVHINRFGYLSDDKLAAIGSLVAGAP